MKITHTPYIETRIVPEVFALFGMLIAMNDFIAEEFD